MKRFLSAVFLLTLGACSSYSSAQLTTPSGAPIEDPVATQSDSLSPKNPSDILVTSGDITDRPYEVVGGIDVQVSKTTIFHPDPTRQLVDEALQRRAAALGADAVINVKYSDVHISFISWGSMDGKGQVVKFKN
tara:strand:- start:206 stop:607 length:402 start_codon:yes stop_codon:yes gene_type:complete